MYTIDASRTKSPRTTSSGVNYEVVDYITGQDQRYIEEPLYASMEMKQKVTGDQEISSFKGTVILAMQDRRFEVALASLDGSSENIIDRLLKLKVADYNEIKDVVSEITGEKKAVASPSQNKNM